MAAHPDNSSESRNQILSKAEPLFAANGFDGVSMREIAEACGMTKANLYYYFADKEALYLHVLERDLLATIDVLERAVADGGTARAQLTRITEAFAAIVQRKRSLLQMAMRHIGGPDGHVRGVFQHHRRRIVQLVEQTLEAGVRSGELRPLNVRLAAMSYMGMMFVYPKMLLENGPADVTDTVVPHTIALYFDGIARR